MSAPLLLFHAGPSAEGGASPTSTTGLAGTGGAPGAQRGSELGRQGPAAQLQLHGQVGYTLSVTQLFPMDSGEGAELCRGPCVPVLGRGCRALRWQQQMAKVTALFSSEITTNISKENIKTHSLHLYMSDPLIPSSCGHSLWPWVPTVAAPTVLTGGARHARELTLQKPSISPPRWPWGPLRRQTVTNPRRL